jgi:hypothetical protein
MDYTELIISQKTVLFKHVETGKAIKPQPFKATVANDLYVHYYREHKRDKGLFENWFHKKFVPEVWNFLKEKILQLYW